MTKTTIAITFLCFFALLAPKSLEADDAYLVHYLVSDIPDLADYTDAHLMGAWGISESGSSPFWISDAGSGFSTLYSTSGSPVTAVVVTIEPSKASGTGAPGIPTGTVYNSSTGGFEVASGKATPFLFDTLDGTIQGWSPSVSATHTEVMVDNSASGAEYTGLAMATDPFGNTYLYAANFSAGTVEMYDVNFNLVPTPGGFRDPTIPSGWAPFNIQNLGGNLYVAFAKQNSSQTFSVSGPGLGYVDVFAPNGVMMQQLVANGPLNAPWGMAIAPAGFGDYAGDVLVGNFGDGTINVFNPTTGAFVAQLSDQIGAPITIPNLWALRPGNGGSGGEKAAVYFTAGIPGPDNGNHGLFGRLHAGPEIAANGVANGANPLGAIAPNTWVAITGANLAETTAMWSAANIVNGALPTELDGVSVTVNGNPAYVYYVSPTQVNFLTSTTLATGTATVQITNNGLMSGTAQFQVQAVAPAFFIGSDGKHVMATHADGSSVTTKSPAAPGETITLYGTGFGPTSPATPEGMMITTPLPVVNTPVVTVGGTTAQVPSANLTSAGVYQIEVVVPATAPNGDVPVIAQVAGVTSPTGLIPVQQ